MDGKPIDLLFKEYAPLTPQVLVERLRPRIERRTKLLYGVYRKYAAEWGGVFMNHDLLFEAVASSYCDLYRLKFFRSVPWVDEHKKAAFAMKWIARIRPVQLHQGVRSTSASIKANAYFAVVSGLALLKIKEGFSQDPWWQKWMTNMVYLLHYHSAPIEFLSSELFVLKTVDETGMPKE